MIYVRWIARLLTLLWAGFWTYFVIAAGLFTAPWEVQRYVVPFVLLAWIGLALAWVWPRVGGGLLLTEGIGLLILIITILNSAVLQNDLFLVLTMALPAITAGILFLYLGMRKAT